MLMKLSKPSAGYIQKRLVGSAQVIAKVDSKKGLNDTFVPKDSIGYIVANHNGDDYSVCLVFWMYSNDSSSHPVKDLLITGKRFTKWSLAAGEQL